MARTICKVFYAPINKPLLAAFAKQNLRLVWRFFGWKWITGGLTDHGPQREYWGLYTMDATGKPACLLRLA